MKSMYLTVSLLLLGPMVVYSNRFNLICKEKEKIEKATEREEKNSASEIYSYDKNIEYIVNLQIKTELNAFYSYLLAAYQFESESMSYPGLSKFFHDASQEELGHAKMLMKYQITRGGSLKGNQIKEAKTVNSSLTAAITWALRLEQDVTTELLCMRSIGNLVDDAHFVDFVESKMIPEQYESMKLLASYQKTLKRMSGDTTNRLAEYHFDMNTLQGSKHVKTEL